ncbi:hypothetical protein DPMN_112012 [Dreissena polymorpha]|uniref:Uncharacterized protein n=1 Tax=Dreissena polymorpha TaxID=45954 RepID=A0A9D4QPL3_DREPO|nr:hypothetical protein DPMN_112012 [Dreissena polymorpha]
MTYSLSPAAAMSDSESSSLDTITLRFPLDVERDITSGDDSVHFSPCGKTSSSSLSWGRLLTLANTVRGVAKLVWHLWRRHLEQ